MPRQPSAETWTSSSASVHGGAHGAGRSLAPTAPTPNGADAFPPDPSAVGVLPQGVTQRPAPVIPPAPSLLACVGIIGRALLAALVAPPRRHVCPGCTPTRLIDVYTASGRLRTLCWHCGAPLVGGTVRHG